MNSILDQVETAFRTNNRRAAWVALPFGALIPIATYFHAHSIDLGAPLWGQLGSYLAAGGLVYSGLTVFSWMHSVTSVGALDRLARAGAVAKAAGFVVLVEGSLAYRHTPIGVSLALLALLVVTNAIALQCSMISGRQADRAGRRASRAKPARVVPLRAAK